MAVQQIRLFGDPVLRTTADPVTTFDKELRVLVRDLTETMVDIEGEAMRPVTWVTVEEVNSGEWGVGGKALTTQDVKDLQASGK